MRYEVTLGPAAMRAIARLTDPRLLIEALLTELAEGPNQGTEVRFDRYVQPFVDDPPPDTVIYTATPLSCDCFTAVHRPMTSGELLRLALERERPVAGSGFYVVDVLPPELAFSRPLRPL